MILSGIVLFNRITFINKFYKFSADTYPQEEMDFVVMSYNVRLFNLFKWIDKNDVGINSEFINEKNQIFCVFKNFPLQLL
jgi:hypothetical protein